MRKILHVGKFYPPHRGGMEQHVYDLVSRQSSHYQVSVLCCAGKKQTTTEFRDGALITRVASFGRLASMPVCPELLWRIRDYQADLIHLHTPNPLGAAAIALAAPKCRVLVEHHSDTVGRRALRLVCHPFVRAAMRRADKIVATSQRYLDASPELRPYLAKSVIVPCGVNLPEPTPDLLENAGRVRQQWGDRLIVAVGRLVPYKGFEVLIQAMRNVEGTLLIIGDGHLRQELLAHIDRGGVSHRVHLLARVPRVEPYLRAAAVFAMPSLTRAEAFGLVQIEAMACGTPVVNTNLDSGVPAISPHGRTGLTVTPGDAVELAAALNLLLNDDGLRAQYGRAARIRSRDFTADLMAERMEAVYASLGVLPSRGDASVSHTGRAQTLLVK